MALPQNSFPLSRNYAELARLTKSLPALVPPGECVYITPPQLAMLNSTIPAMGYPGGLAEAELGSAQLTRCNYFVLSTLSSRQANYPPFYPWQALQGWTEVVQSFEIEVDGRKALAAEMLRRRTQLSESADRVPE
jgi:hypothetical protein